MSRKRIWLFVVEGETDKTSIGLSIEELVKSDTVDFDVFCSDIFGAAQYWTGVDSVMRIKDICDRVRKEVVEYLDGADYSWGDLDRIVLLLDTDGSFIPNHLVVENVQIEHICYFADHVEAPNADHVRKRNIERSSNVRRMIGRGRVTYNRKSVPVEVYFFSRNLEHALHNKSGQLSDRMKARLANEFRSAYKNDSAGFIRLFEEDLAVPGDYQGTWKYVFEDAHSLERGSNLHILLQLVLDGHD